MGNLGVLEKPQGNLDQAWRRYQQAAETGPPKGPSARIGSYESWSGGNGNVGGRSGSAATAPRPTPIPT